MAPFVNIHTHKPCNTPIEVVNMVDPSTIPDHGLFSFGIHPWNIARTDVDADLRDLENICDEKKIIALGEIGLDKVIDTDLELQAFIFLKQIHIANQYRLSVIIHCVRAWSELASLSKHYPAAKPWIYHGFTGNEPIAQQIIRQGHFVSFGEALLKSPKLQQVFIKLPLDFIFFETDDSDEKIETIYKKAAELRHICTDELKETIHRNFETLFTL
ncbi:MAG: TatD family hydrolase [Salinivirgaceae bacterium]|nr:TatD family hydrolase [Salinivirgaceae bacterium]